jgi:glycosyltransferase involved in cell wall biosynthesis
MKILVATFTYYPNVDGVSEAACTMVRNFRNAGHEVCVATSRGDNPTDAHNDGEESVGRFLIAGAPALAKGFRGESQAYRDFIVSLDPDVIVFHGWDTWPVEMALPLLPDLRARSVLLSHGQSSHLLNPRILPHGLGKWLRWLPHVCKLPWRIRRFDKVVFLSHKTDWRRFFDARIARLTGARNISVIPNGVPELQNTPPGIFRQRHCIGSGPLFLCIANYSERKNQERALRAFAEAALPDATLVLIGSELGDYGRRMIALWDNLKIEGKTGQALFFEGLHRVETISALRDCDVKVLAADAETQPIVLLEAMAASKPFISTNTGCVEEFKGGILVRNAGEMANEMRRLATSPQERERLGSDGRRDYEAHYSLERTSKAWLKLLEELTAG